MNLVGRVARVRRVINAHRLWFHSILGLRVINKNKVEILSRAGSGARRGEPALQNLPRPGPSTLISHNVFINGF